jgi:hypothetical protein
MAYIPIDAEWYIAELISEIRVEDDPANVLHRNFVLVKAASPENAYERAIELGNLSEISYENPVGKVVRISFRGLGDLNVIHDKLEHGAEIMYSEDTCISEEQIVHMIRPKADLAVFRATEQPVHADYSSAEVVRQVERIVSE